MYSFIGTILSAITIVVISFVLLQHQKNLGALSSGAVVSYNKVTNAFAANPGGG